MEFSGLDILKEQTTIAQQSIAGIQALKEYCESYAHKALRFIEQQSGTEQWDDTYISLPLLTDPDSSPNEKTICAITPHIYSDALENETGISWVRKSDQNGDYAIVQNKEILDAFEQSVQECEVMSEYISTCLVGLDNPVRDFASRVKAKFPGIPGNLIANYEQLFAGDDALRSISNLLQMKTNCSFNNSENWQLVVYGIDNFDSAQVWTVAICEVANTITGFFKGIWRGLQDLDGFFTRLLESFRNLIKWCAQKAFKQLSTNFEKGGSLYGYIDIPIMQLPFDFVHIKVRNLTSENRDDLTARIVYNRNTTSTYDTVQSALYYYLADNWDRDKSLYYDYLYKANCKTKTYCKNEGDWDATSRLRTMMDCIVPHLFSINDKTFAIEGRPYDIVMPTSTIVTSHEILPSTTQIPFQPFDTLIRFLPLYMGKDPDWLDDDADCWLIGIQVFPMADWSTVENLKDYETACHVGDTVKAIISYIAGTFWTVSDDGPHTSQPTVTLERIMQLYQEYMYTEIYDNSLVLDRTQPAPDGPFNVVSLLSTNWVYDLRQFINHAPGEVTGFNHYVDSLHSYVSRFNVLKFIQNLLNYCALNGPGFSEFSISPSWGSLAQLMFPCNLNDVDFVTSSGSDSVYGSEVFKVPSFESFDEVEAWFEFYQSSFHPYVKYNLYNISVHYQSYREQVEEAKFVIWSAIAAIAAVTLASLIHKFRRDRVIKLELAQANLDSYAWSLPSNPTGDQIAQYKKLRSKAKRINSLNDILGISSSASSSNFLFNSISEVKDQLLATQGYSENVSNSSITLKTINKNIIGH